MKGYTIEAGKNMFSAVETYGNSQELPDELDVLIGCQSTPRVGMRLRQKDNGDGKKSF